MKYIKWTLILTLTLAAHVALIIIIKIQYKEAQQPIIHQASMIKLNTTINHKPTARHMNIYNTPKTPIATNMNMHENTQNAFARTRNTEITNIATTGKPRKWIITYAEKPEMKYKH